MNQRLATQVFVDRRLGPDLLWRDVRISPYSFAAPALFLDRDGVIIGEKNYIANPNDVEMLPGIPELIQAARQSGMAVVEITNQAGIGRGYFGWPEFVAVEDRVTEVLAKHRAGLDAVLACPFHADGRPPYRHPDHPWRKPNPGMLTEAARLLNLDLSQSVLVGDKAADQVAAQMAGLRWGIHVLTGYGEDQQETARNLNTPNSRVLVARSASEAAALLPIKSPATIPDYIK